MKLRFAITASALALATTSVAQEPNPRGAATATILGKKVSVDYGRPALKGRSLGELLKQLPADRMWRAGENQVTTFTTEADLTIGGKRVPAGKYTLYVHAPESGEWALALNKDPGVPLGTIWDKAPANLKNEPWPHLADYEKAAAATEVVRAPMKPGQASPTAELFTIHLKPASDGALMTLSWGDQSWLLDIKPAK